jgi:hypothetical protein
MDSVCAVVGPVAPVEIRQTYKEFLNGISELLDGELSSEELQQSGALVYNILHDLESPVKGPALFGKRYTNV